MKTSTRGVIVQWNGPFSWPGFEDRNGLPSVPTNPGIYLLTVPYQDGLLVYAAGMTTRPIATRLREHTYKYCCGEYNVLNFENMCHGKREIVWQGWSWTDEKRQEFETRRAELTIAIERQLGGFRVMVADPGFDKRTLYRLEAAIMNTLYDSEPPFCDVPDRGMSLAPRWQNEPPILIRNETPVTLYGLPEAMEI